MPVLAEPKLMSIDEFVAMADVVGYELIEGVLTETTTMGAYADLVAMQFVFWLTGFCRERDAGYVFGSETTYRCFDHPNTGRRGDVSVVRKDRIPDGRIPPGYVDFPADLIIEVISPNDLAYKVERKLTSYLRHGFGEVWLVYPNVQTVHVHRLDQPTLTFGPGDTLLGRGLLEGFACPIAQLFPFPPPTEP